MDDLMNTTACTLPTARRPLRLAEFDALFTERVRSVERDGDVVRMRLAGSAGLRARVLDLTEREKDCCSFFTFLIEGHDDELTLQISVPPERRDILTALVDRATELST